MNTQQQSNHQLPIIVCNPIFTCWKFILQNNFEKIINQAELENNHIFDLPIEDDLYNFWQELTSFEIRHIPEFLNKINLLNNSFITKKDLQSKTDEYRLNYLDIVIDRLMHAQLSHLHIDLQDDRYNYVNSDIFVDLCIAIRAHYCNKKFVFSTNSLINEIRKIALVIANTTNPTLYYKLLNKIQNKIN